MGPDTKPAHQHKSLCACRGLVYLRVGRASQSLFGRQGSGAVNHTVQYTVIRAVFHPIRLFVRCVLRSDTKDAKTDALRRPLETKKGLQFS